ncbi:MAG: PAS domain S-box protein, partial [Candidatus Binatia bacterium]
MKRTKGKSAASLRKQTKARLPKAGAEDAKFLELLESSPYAVLIVDHDGRIVLVNGQTENIFGYSKSELLGKPVETLLPEPLRDLHVDHRANYGRDPRPRPMGSGLDLYGRRKDGSLFPVEISLSPSSTRNGVVVTSFVRDITERKQALEKIQRQLKSLNLLVAGARKLVESPRMDDLAQGILDTLVTSFGIRLAWIGRADPDGLVRPLCWAGEVADYLKRVEIRWDDSPLGQGPAGRAIRTGRPVVMDIATDPGFAIWRKPALEHGFREVAAFPLMRSDQPFGHLILYSDEREFFTDERVGLLQTYTHIAAAALENCELYEQTKRQAAELENANTMQADFAAMIAHDLRSPLTAILSTAALLKEGLIGPVNDEQKKWLAKIEGGTYKLIDLVSDFLDVAKLEAGELSLDIQRLNLNQLVQESIDNHLPLAKDKKILVASRLDTTLPRIHVDPSRLDQVLSNLLS